MVLTSATVEIRSSHDFIDYGSSLNQEMYRKMVLICALKSLAQNMIGFKPFKLQQHSVMLGKYPKNQIKMSKVGKGYNNFNW